ncbi:MAG: hypothetical protein A2Z72_02800 [Omnitrophica bacterium RBG_13_46_9]|nr:MAG: hypothetical protein A2Z72_02800 [Omnitrophica bacterium RBG_13_46_9]
MFSLIVLYVVTIICSIVIALLLVYSANLSSKPKESADKDKVVPKYPKPAVLPNHDFRKMLYNEISEVVDSRSHCHKIAETVSDIFRRELEREVDYNNTKLSTKYEEVIKEKDASEQIAWKKYQKTLDDKKKTEAVIRSITEGLLVIDAKGKVVMMNPAAESLLDVSKKDKIGKSILEDIKETQLLSLFKSSRDKEGMAVELISQRDETKKILRASSAVIEDENGQTVGMVSVLNDITKQKELDQLKENFVANVSHELRTPLVAIEKSISLMIDGTTGKLLEEQAELLSIAKRNLKRLNFLINDLLELSKLEAGKTKLRREASSIEKIINEVIESLETWAKSKSLKIEKDIEEKLPELEIDPNRITQVLNNLLGNSIKFTPENGTILVKARLLQEKLEVEVSVRDTGIGISKENLSTVFDKFYQAGERVATDISGTGIGLSIAKEIVELHGGKIRAESEKGKGADFIFTLPVKPFNSLIN